MAAPEIELPLRSPEIAPQPERHEPNGQALETAMPDSGESKIGGRSQETLRITCSKAPIREHYLTFDTLLPIPSTVEVDGLRGPDMPDLKDCVSPLRWSKSRKVFTTWLSCAATVVTAYTAGSYAPANQQMMAYWDVGEVAINVGITTFTTGFAIAPMFLAPFSELVGRKPVFIVSGILFVICQLCCGLTRLYSGMLVARFFAGVGSSTFSTMVGGVVSDIYLTEDRNTAMSLFSGAALFGTGLGPLCSGFIAQHLEWRWVFFVQTITCFILMLMLAIFFKETRGPVLLSRKAKRLNQWMEARERAGLTGFQMPIETEGRTESQRIRWKVKADEERQSLEEMIFISLYRPFMLLFTEPVVFFFSLWVAFAWAVLYLTFTSIPLVFGTNHDFNTEQSGAIFASMCIASVLSSILSIYQEKLARYVGIMSANPEGRLYFACIQSALMPIGLFWFGWTSFASIPWIVPAIAIGCATMGIFSIYLAVFNYLADVYHSYASSALAAQSFCRNMLGGVFPLITTFIFTQMGYPLACTMLGGIAAALTIVPWILVFQGKSIRKRSKFAMSTSTDGDLD